ncbi:DUF2207 family protein [Pseudonocardia lacus]|uniref:DUF2207 family protein n=1 Tax=Pseudonocardia lacus TaxID=2835865 RepID=UPI001BDBC262|nr:TPM domain-containing protein [Pseudonocardia lacus]
MPSTRSSPHPLVRLLLLTLLVAASALMGTPALAQDAEAFPDLDPARHVYDQTGSSLDAAQLRDVEGAVERLGAAGADVVVVVRALDADSDDTFDQVEALQQEWVRVTGTDQDRAVAVLVNRNPDDPTDARAGLFVGRTYAEGNVPEGEQRDIVEDALIPPLREGDVRGGLVAALDRLESSIRSGPPVSAFDRFAADASRGWLPWTAIGLAAAGLVAALLLHRGRSRGNRGAQEPTTRRPDDLSPALGGALVAGGPPMQVVPAVLLDLAGRGAVAIEAESEGGWASSPKVRVRLIDGGAVRDGVERAVWDRLAEKAEDGVVTSSHLAAVATWSGPVREAVRAQMRERKWLDPRAGAARVLLAVIAGALLLAAVFALLLSGVGGGPLLAWVGVVALFAVAVTAFVFLLTYPALTPAGLEAAVPWTAYRDGLKKAAKDRDTRLDLDAVLPDAVALGLGDALGDRLKTASEEGVPLRAFASGRTDDANLAAFPWWIAFSSSTAGTSSTSTVSGAGAGGGGGAAGST